MLRVKNFVPAISVEGFEEATDYRRGRGTYAAVVRAMDMLKRHKLPFGISCCYTSKNVEVIGSEEYFDQMVDWGAKFAWFFTYMPVGREAVPELMVSADQRAFMYRRIREFRHTKPIFTMDFWNDGEFVGGCIAGARSYLHINANGDIEPCAFIHYADSNIRSKTLLEAYKSPLFMAYHRGPALQLQPPAALARCWITPKRSRAWCTRAARRARTSRRRRMWTRSPESAAKRPKSGPSRPTSSGARAIPIDKSGFPERRGKPLFLRRVSCR